LIHDVIIAGAGPVGLFLACELRLAKLSVLVLEQMEDPHSPLKRLPFGMRGLWGPSVEAFYRRGLLEQIASQPRADDSAPGQPRPGSIASGSRLRGPAGHFAGIQFDYSNIDSSRWTYRLPSPADTQLGSEMEHLERVLAAHALSVGVEVQRGHGVEGFEPSNDEVTVRAGEQRVRARFLVGCDGGRSTVRKQGDFEFVGSEPEFTGYSVQVEIADPSILPLGRHYTPTGMYTQWQPGVIAIADFDGGASHRVQPLTCEHVQSVLRRVSCTDVTLKALNVASTWTDRSKQATTYRKGRVLLAGDAAICMWETGQTICEREHRRKLGDARTRPPKSRLSRLPIAARGRPNLTHPRSQCAFAGRRHTAEPTLAAERSGLSVYHPKAALRGAWCEVWGKIVEGRHKVMFRDQRGSERDQWCVPRSTT
jgi:2-polyprenyl-6-methoxyphenol hydroxylase-like FAD-dependent oxidoreductase